MFAPSSPLFVVRSGAMLSKRMAALSYLLLRLWRTVCTAVLGIISLGIVGIGASAAHAQGTAQAPGRVAGAKDFTTRSRLVVHALPLASPATVVQLWVTIPQTLSPKDHRFLTPFAHALAQGKTQANRPSFADVIKELGGETQVEVNRDVIVVSMVVPARHTSVALSFADARLARRRRLLPAVRPVGPIIEYNRRVGALPIQVRKLWAPNHAYQKAMRPNAGVNVTTADLGRVGDALLRRGQVELVIASAFEHRKTAVLLDRYLRTRLPTARLTSSTSMVQPLPGRHMLDLGAPPKGEPGQVLLYLPLPPARDTRERMLREIMSTHVDGTLIEQTSGVMLVIDQTSSMDFSGSKEIDSSTLSWGKRIDRMVTLSKSDFERAKAKTLSRVAQRGQMLASRVYFQVFSPVASQLDALEKIDRAAVTSMMNVMKAAPVIIGQRRHP